jgi:hypothetical protein
MMGIVKTVASFVGSAAIVAALLSLVVKALQPRASRSSASEAPAARSTVRGF